MHMIQERRVPPLDYEKSGKKWIHMKPFLAWWLGLRSSQVHHPNELDSIDLQDTRSVSAKLIIYIYNINEINAVTFSELGDSRAAENHSIMEDFITSTDCSQVALLKYFLASHHCLSSIEPLVCAIHTPPQREEEEPSLMKKNKLAIQPCYQRWNYTFNWVIAIIYLGR